MQVPRQKRDRSSLNRNKKKESSETIRRVKGQTNQMVRRRRADVLATAIGATQMLAMLGGSAGQFAVGPMIQRGLGVKEFWMLRHSACTAIVRVVGSLG